MLHRPSLLAELEKKHAAIVAFERRVEREAGAYVARLDRLTHADARRLRDAMMHGVTVGAVPSSEFDRSERMIRPFQCSWTKHDAARAWAMEILRDRVTFAADGSQVLPGRDISLPIACVQIAVFENPHAAHIPYRKALRLELVTPDELLAADGDKMTPEIAITLKRFEIEVEEIEKFIRSREGWQARGERMPLAFFDGTLLTSFTRPRTTVRERYAASIARLMDSSEAMRVPVIGFIDQSYARDLTAMLDFLEGINHRTDNPVCDAQVLRARRDDVDDDNAHRLAAWGDRTTFCYGVRDEMHEAFRDAENRARIGFTYLQTTSDGTPARLDIPAWVLDAGLMDETVDTVRAECVVGNGYPYPIEAADAAAVLSVQDRAQFLRTVSDFAANAEFDFQISRKALSKTHRR
ncbi:MAG: DNA double-strand break repair nuclease NurA [Pyrinomonadaceae bacterium MAG19_C2-C3]|nr:DNA double-strand break repair nuclease NurA [Pyrinomonadaceae bacterium MAG19_C2-C3]